MAVSQRAERTTIMNHARKVTFHCYQSVLSFLQDESDKSKDGSTWLARKYYGPLPFFSAYDIKFDFQILYYLIDGRID